MTVTITDDFDLDRIAESGQCFRWEKKDGGTYRILAGKSCLYITPQGQDRYEFDCTEEDFCFWQDYLDLHEDYRKIRSRISPDEDPFLWQAAGQEKGIRILRQGPWETLITFIISQNKNIPAIRRCVSLLAQSCGEKKTDSRGETYYAFPDPGRVTGLTQQTLLSCGLGYRWKYVHAAAEAVSEGAIDLDRLIAADEDTAISALSGLYGVGAKVANCVSLFGLHHIDAFPVDVWVKRILAQQYPGGYPYQKYTPYNGVYQQYMFACYRHSRMAGAGDAQDPDITSAR